MERLHIKERRQWLIDLRKQLKMTQEEVANKAGIERSTYTKAENGNPVSVPTAKKIANVLNCEWYLFFENDCDDKGQSKLTTSSA